MYKHQRSSELNLRNNSSKIKKLGTNITESKKYISAQHNK